jgi:S-adenosylmethionine/arginine decarboxylase-like enzyme
MAFGESLHIDMYEIDSKMCDDLEFFYDLLIDLVEFLNMNMQSPPFIFRSQEDLYPDKAGLSGWVPLIESGIQVHTLKLQCFVTLDIYTCGKLEIENTLQFLKDKLNTTNLECKHLIRGNYYRR